MKYSDGRLELTRRNLEILQAKLDDPLSVRTIAKDGMSVTAVEGGAKPPSSDRVQLTRKDIEFLLAKGSRSLLTLPSVDLPEGLEVFVVENDAHYSDRPPGEMFMPSTGEYL